METTADVPVQQRDRATAGCLWSIAEVERDTGLGKDTLRVWERRYGFPTPTRDAFGERQYDSLQLARLRLIKRLLDAGYRPGKVVAQPLPELEALSATASRQSRASGVLKRQGRLDLDPQWMTWLLADQFDLLRNGLQQQVLRQGLAHTVEQLVAPLCVEVGEAWLRGELSVYQEHLFTEAVQNVLRDAIAAADNSGREHKSQPRVLLTTTPTEKHALGLLMAECFFALESCERLALGPCTPIPDIVLATRQLDIDVVALSFSGHASRREVEDSLVQLVEQLPSATEVWVGGAAALMHRKGLPDRVLVMRRPSDVVMQVSAWRMRQGHRRA